VKKIQIIQNWAVEPPGTIADFLDEHGLAYEVVKSYDGAAMPEVDNSEAVIVLGCPHSVNTYQEFDFLKRLYAYMAAVVRKDLPLLGICLGGQMLAKVLGAEVRKNDIREIGLYKARLTEAGRIDPVFAGFDDEFDVFHWHNDTFKIPHGAVQLVEGTECRNQAFRKGNAVAIQFHVEPRAEDVPRWCDEYTQELTEDNKTRESIVSEFEAKADVLKKMSHRLMKNLLG